MPEFARIEVVYEREIARITHVIYSDDGAKRQVEIQSSKGTLGFALREIERILGKAFVSMTDQLVIHMR